MRLCFAPEPNLVCFFYVAYARAGRQVILGAGFGIHTAAQMIEDLLGYHNKTLVYNLARYRNSLSFVIPERVLTKEPTAELKPNQKDRDTLAPYAELDPILKAYVEEDKDLFSIISQGFDKETVAKVLNMVDKSAYKRRQSPPGIKITPKAFGRDRRMPITNSYPSITTPYKSKS